MALLEIVEARKSYAPEVVAVRDVSLSLERGEILCLLGPSGCGKTTLLRLVAGLEQLDSGVIRFEGRDMAGVPPHARGFGMMFQDFALFPHKNVRENIGFGLRMQGLSSAEIELRVAEMLELVGLAEYGERPIDQLSGGEQQRVALARALAPGPQLLMLDEPLGALDRALRERLMLDVRAILKRVGMTALYVTHDQTEAFAVADRIAVMNAGLIEQLGPPQAIYRRPATPFVAQFLGFHNLLPARVNTEGNAETAIGVFRPDEPVPPAGTEETLLIKPVFIEAELNEAKAADVNEIIGLVDEVTFRGRFSQVWLSVNGTRLLFEATGDFPFQPGDVVRLAVSPDQLQLYESSSGVGK